MYTNGPVTWPTFTHNPVIRHPLAFSSLAAAPPPPPGDPLVCASCLWKAAEADGESTQSRHFVGQQINR